MASVSQKARILGALVIAGVLIGGSLFVSYGNLNFLNPSYVNAASTQQLLQDYAQRDSDHDGLPDWEEELYGLDPNNAHSFSPDMTDGEAVARGLVKPKFLTPTANSSEASSTNDADQLEGVIATPGSLTDQFSQIMLQEYLSQSADAASNGTEPSEEDVDTAAQSALQQFALQNEHQDAYSMAQIQQGGSGPAAMKQYAADMTQTFALHNPYTAEGELDYFSAALEKNDPTALKQISLIGTYYTDLAPAMMEVKVPIEGQNAHLEIANAAARLGADITDMSMLNSDPLRAYFGLAQYQTDSAALALGIGDIGSVFSSEQITPNEGDAGAEFITTAIQTHASESQSAADTNAPN